MPRTILITNWIVYTLSKPKYGVPRVTSRMCVKKPTLKANERAVKIRTTLPESLFTIPEIEATLAIKESDVVLPDVNIDVIDPELESTE